MGRILKYTDDVSEERAMLNMKSALFAIAGLCAAAVGWIVWGPKRAAPLEKLAENLEMAWADHHTVS